ncbi:MAG: DUF2971 domain-containing protein, partial [Thermoanaerobaculia bacterium]|nr:DUF2971 domain-containing protein [Thermoanaerobaculia bacterium]
FKMDDFSRLTDHEVRVRRLFYPHMTQRLESVGPDGRFVHYSTAEAGVGILTNKEVWLRNTSCMNDFSEVQHGLNLLADTYKSPVGQRFQAILNDNLDGVCEEFAQLFDRHQDALRHDSFVICVSEHRRHEDITGRLSMWRAYGSTSGVALVMSAAPFRSETNLLRAYSTPVRYASKDDLQQDFSELVSGLEKNIDLLKQLGREEVRRHLFNMFKWAALSIKHPGFVEEQEWRVVYTPSLERSDVIAPDVKLIRGVPQTVYKLPLRKFDGTTFSTAVPDVIDKIIIGPTAYPLAMRDAFIELLHRAGVPDPGTRVQVSDIPLRA